MALSTSLPLVEILQVGLSGLCFLLALLAYRLIEKEQRVAAEPRKGIIHLVKTFMAVNLVASLLCFFASYVGSSKEVGPNENFSASSDYVVDYTSYLVDLSLWVPGVDSPVTVTRTDFIRKQTDTVKDYIIPFFTLGTNIHCEPINFSTRPEFRKKNDPMSPGLHYDYVLPVGHQPRGYTESVSSRFIFPSSFRNASNEWWAASVAYPAKTIVVTIKFPDDKPCKSMGLSRIAGLSGPEAIRNNPPTILQNGRIVNWVGLNEEGRSRIRFDWAW